MGRDAQYHEWLLPYLEGGLDEARRTQLEARLAADPALAAEAAHMERALDGLRGAAVRTPPSANAQAPADLWPRLRARLEQEAPASAPRPRAHGWWLAGVGATAAASLLLVAVWLPGWHAPELSEPSHMPLVRPKAAPTPPAVPAGSPRPAGSVPGAGASGPLPAMKSKAMPKPLPQSPAITGANPFALPRPAVPPPNMIDTPATAPAATVTPLMPDSRAVSPPPVRSSAAKPEAQRATATGKPALVPPPAPIAAPPAPPPHAPKPVTTPLPAPPSPAPGQAAPPSATAQDRSPPAVGLSGGMAGPVPKEAASAGAAEQKPKPPPIALYRIPTTTFRQPSHGTRRNKTGERDADAQATGNALQAFGAAAPARLASWQGALAGAVQSPLWGEAAGEQQANQALMAAREAGMLDELRARLEARRTQTPHDVATGRMLAAVYDFGFSSSAALRERRRVTGLEGADGEDWFALAQAEERAGNRSAAQAAYRHALESAIPPSSFHAEIARGRS